MVVDPHEAAVPRDAELLEPEPVHAGLDAGGHQRPLRAQLLAADERDGDSVALRADALDARVGAHGDSLLRERALEDAAHLLVLAGKQMGQELDDGDIRPVGAEQVRELDADRAAADHHQRRGRLAQRQRFAARDHALAVRLHAGQGTRPGAGRDDDVRGLDHPLAGRHHQRGGAAEARRPRDHLHPVLPEQHADAVRERRHHLAAAVDRATEVEVEVLVGDADRRAVADRAHDPGGVEQRLARDASPVQAEAAQRVALDQRGSEAELRRADGGDVAAGARPDDRDVVLRHDRRAGSVRRSLAPRAPRALRTSFVGPGTVRSSSRAA